MIRLIKALLVATAFTSMACSQDINKASDNQKKPNCPVCIQGMNAESYQLSIVNSLGDKMANAKVMVGPKKDVPFENNIFQSDANGLITFSKTIPNNTPVTVWQHGYVTATYFIENNRSSHLLSLHETDQSIDPNAPDKIQVKGLANGFGDLTKKDGFIDFSLTIPTFTRQSLLHFDLSSVISPEVDTISVIGQKVELPSNLSLPKQKEVLARRFGLLGYEPSTLEEVGREISLTRERVRQIKEKAIRRLKHTSRSKILKTYLG